MRAALVNTLNPQRTAMIVTNFLETGKVASPADLRYHEDLMFPSRLIKEAGNVKVRRPLRDVTKPSRIDKWKEVLPEEKFILSHDTEWTDMVPEHGATSEVALRGWLLAAHIAKAGQPGKDLSIPIVKDASFLDEVRAKGWHTDRFLDGTGTRFA